MNGLREIVKMNDKVAKESRERVAYAKRVNDKADKQCSA